MSTLRTLHDAFDTLAQRADQAPVVDREYSVATEHRHGSRVLAPAAAAVAVVLVAGATVEWAHSRANGSGGSAAAATAPAVSGPANPIPSASASTSTGPSGFEIPSSGAELAAKAAQILAGTATIRVTYSSDPDTTAPSLSPTPTESGRPGSTISAGGSSFGVENSAGSGFTVTINGTTTVTAPAPAGPAGSAPSTGTSSGASIVGTLTAGGHSGGFQLNVDAAQPGDKAFCDDDAGTACVISTRPDGTSLAVGTWLDRSVPGGSTYEVDAVHPDGTEILMILSTEADPKGESTVTSPVVPLTSDQLVAFVTSTLW